MAKPRKLKTPGDDSQTVDLDGMLRARMDSLSPSEQSVAGYMLDNIQMLPFETGVSIAQAAGVSEMTVTRFVRGFGFDSLRDLKSKLRNSLAQKDSDVDDYMARFQTRDEQSSALQESLKLDLEAVVKAYELTATEVWGEAAKTLAEAHMVYVVGFQASKGLALDFASRLLWARPNVVFIDNASGTFGEIVTADPENSVVVLVDTAAYAVRGVRLAGKLKELNMPLIIVTDKFSHWAFSYTRLVFETHTHVRTFWDSTAGISVVLNLMIDAVATRLGPRARDNFSKMSDMATLLGEFVGGSYLRRKD